MKVNFINVGNNSMNWTANLKSITFESLERQVKNKGALMSQTIDFTFDEQTQKGSIFVGMFRKVGDFEVIQSDS